MESDAIKGMSSLHGFSHPDGDGARDYGGPLDPRRFNSQSDSRKAASAMIAEIPFELAQWVARVFKPTSIHVLSVSLPSVGNRPIS